MRFFLSFFHSRQENAHFSKAFFKRAPMIAASLLQLLGVIGGLQGVDWHAPAAPRGGGGRGDQ
jgi:hypothetical protein